MNEDDKHIEPATNLSLVLGYSSECIQKVLNNEDPGAGANAASRLDMAFVATDPLSELVWSSQKGLRLKCADGSFCNKNPSLSWGVGPNNMASGSSSNKPIASSDRPINKKSSTASVAECNLHNEAARGDDSTRSPTSNAGIKLLSGSSIELKTATGDQIEEMGNVVGIPFLHKDDQRNHDTEDEPKLDVAQNDEEPIVKATKDSGGNDVLGIDIVLPSEIHPMKECEVHDTKMQNSTSLGKRHMELSPTREIYNNNKIFVSTRGNFPLDNLESTAENDLETPISENVCHLTIKNVALECSDRVENQQDDELLSIDKTFAVKQSPTNSRIQMDQTKGKSKVLSDGDTNERMLNEEDGSHESVESCNSAGPLSTGKRHWNFEQQLILGSERVKGQVEDGPRSSLLIKQDSSFMNWISNMMKGFSKPSEGVAPSGSPALANPNHGQENPDQDFITYNRNEDNYSRTIGFQSIFQSLYCRKRKLQETLTLNLNHQTEGAKQLELDNEIYDLNATPIACRMVAGNVYKRFVPSNERFNESTSGNQVSPVVHCKDLSMSFATIQENSRSKSTENKTSCNLATDKEKNGTSSNSSREKDNTSVEKIDSELPSEVKTACNFGYKSDPLQSLWIARFTPKTSGPSLKQDPSNKSNGEALDCSADDLRLKSLLQNPLSSCTKHENEEVREQFTEEPLHLQKCGTATEASFGFHKIEGNHGDKSIYKLNPILPFPKLKNSEAMASVFAGRLDALKHISASDEPDNAACATVTCFFCGLKGHHLQECPKIPDPEFEDLLRNVNLYKGIKEVHCVCIRCFQLNHWAVSCPTARSSTRNEAECEASLVNQFGPSKMLYDVWNEDATISKDISAGARSVYDRNDSGLEKDLNLTWKSNETANSGKVKMNIKLFDKEIASSSRVKRLKETLMAPLFESINCQISDIPKAIFDAIRWLRLSRTDVLKWTNSHMPLSNLNGFFLRLRLGKWEEDLGGTGYYVACITGAQMESSPQKSKISIAVNVGGIKCLVESQYVSNHDFIEDELMAWWSATRRSGGNLPSEEELRLRVKEKKTLGFRHV